jgi:hypothetical protein
MIENEYIFTSILTGRMYYYLVLSQIVFIGLLIVVTLLQL